MKLTKEQMAAKLNGRQYGDEMSKADEATAKESGLLVVFGYSDDNTEFRGLFHDEVVSMDGGNIAIDPFGILPTWDDVCDDRDEDVAQNYFRRKENMRKIEVLWGNEESGGFTWAYKTDIPHATFEIFEDGDKFCRGIVIDVKDLKVQS